MDYNMVITTPMDETTGQPTQPGAINGGMMARDGQITNPVITVEVPDIDATLQTVERLGGWVVLPKNEIPGMGYFAYFKDPENNIMGLWENLPADQQAQAAG
jgi:predicted enzyme related to lactoylglutathione lyase